MTRENLQNKIKEYLNHLDTMLEYDEGIEVNSVDEFVQRANKYMEGKK